ncbi:unnamed protein product, partial [Tetraodon nigroviridis]
VDEDDFWKACDQNNLLVINRYLTTGGDVDACDVFKRTGLHRACSLGHIEVVTRLIEARANIDSRDKLWSTCVHAACRGGHLSVLQLLLKHGADITAADKLNSTPLHVSVRTGHLDCVQYLIHNGASVNTQDRSHFDADYSATAWVHSLVDCNTMLFGRWSVNSSHPSPGSTSTPLKPSVCVCVCVCVAPIGSLISNRWSCRVSVITGGLLSSCGLLLSSFSKSLAFLYFSMGIMMGLGFALCYAPAIAMVGCYFHKRMALAYGVGLSGSGIGTFVLAPAVQLLIDLYSWRGALLVLSAFVANLCVCGALLRPITLQNFNEKEESDEDSKTEAEVSRLFLPESRRRCLDSCILSSQDYSFLLLPDFLGLALSFLLLASGCSLPFIYLVPYALGNGVSQQNAAFLMSILGVIDIVGNVTFGWLTDRKCLKPYRLGCYIFAVTMEGLCCLFVTLLQTFPLLVPFAVFYGYFDGAYVALIPVVTSDLVGRQHLSSALGVAYFLHGIPYLISPPIGGRLVDVTGNYTATFFLSGGAILTSALTLTIIAGIRHCRRVRLAKESEHWPLSRSCPSKRTISLPLTGEIS